MERLNRNRLLIFGILFIVGIFASALITRKCTAEKQVAPVERTDKVENIVVLPPAAPEADPGYIPPQPTAPPPADAERVVRPKTPPPTTAAPTDTLNLATSVYRGVIKGDWGMTIDESSRLVYYCKNNIHSRENLDRTTVHLNGENGVSGVSVGDYYIFTTDMVITNEKIKLVRTWAVFVGYNTQDGWGKWLPYEWVVRVDNSLLNNSGIIAANNGYHFRTKLSLQKK